MSSDGVDPIVAELTLEEKLALVRGTADPDGTATGYVPPIDRLGVPALRLVDGPLGVRTEGERATAFPASLALAASWDPSLAREAGTALAREARAHGQDVLLAPGVNLIRVPHGGRNFEYYSEDPYLTARFAVGTIEGVQSEDVAATVKHYVANNQETNRYTVSAAVEERPLRELYLPAFRAAVEEADVAAVMTAYNRVNGVHMSDHRRLLREVLEGEWGFEGVVMSDWWGTESTVGAAEAGVDLEMPGEPFENLPAAAALPDDVDPATVEFPDSLPDMHGGGLFGDPLRTAVETGAIDETLVDEKVRRVLRTMDRFGLLDREGAAGERADDWRDGRSAGALKASEHRRLARRLAIEGTVLLKNDGALPLADDVAVALVGPNADAAKLGGGGSSEVTPLEEVSPLDGLRERAAELTFERGVSPVAESSLFDALAPEESDDTGGDDPAGSEGDRSADAGVGFDAAVAAAEAADCAIVVVQDDTTEGRDRADLRLPGRQDALVAAVADAAERTVVVLRTSGAVELPWLDAVDAVLETWYPGQADGAALAAVCYGDADPGGRLPVTFGRREADYPTNPPERFPGVDDEARYEEGVFVGYRYFDSEGTEPSFPFGHGLSYAAFAYGEPTIARDDRDDGSDGDDGTGDDGSVANGTEDGAADGDRGGDDGGAIALTVPVENVGDRPGSEVVQVYVREDEPLVARPDRELKGFAKVRLDPGERRRVTIRLDRDAFAHYEAETGWTVTPGSFTLLVGRSSRDVRSKLRIRIE